MTTIGAYFVLLLFLGNAFKDRIKNTSDYFNR